MQVFVAVTESCGRRGRSRHGGGGALRLCAATMGGGGAALSSEPKCYHHRKHATRATSIERRPPRPHPALVNVNPCRVFKDIDARRLCSGDVGGRVQEHTTRHRGEAIRGCGLLQRHQATPNGSYYYLPHCAVQVSRPSQRRDLLNAQWLTGYDSGLGVMTRHSA